MVPAFQEALAVTEISEYMAKQRRMHCPLVMSNIQGLLALRDDDCQLASRLLLDKFCLAKDQL